MGVDFDVRVAGVAERYLEPKRAFLTKVPAGSGAQ
jgi:hypothetical protein